VNAKRSPTTDVLSHHTALRHSTNDKKSLTSTPNHRLSIPLAVLSAVAHSSFPQCTFSASTATTRTNASMCRWTRMGMWRAIAQNAGRIMIKFERFGRRKMMPLIGMICSWRFWRKAGTNSGRSVSSLGEVSWMFRLSSRWMGSVIVRALYALLHNDSSAARLVCSLCAEVALFKT
jgi:hypothetical protein